MKEEKKAKKEEEKEVKKNNKKKEEPKHDRRKEDKKTEKKAKTEKGVGARQEIKGLSVCAFIRDRAGKGKSKETIKRILDEHGIKYSDATVNTQYYKVTKSSK